jgi:hypothetical protein
LSLALIHSADLPYGNEGLPVEKYKVVDPDTHYPSHAGAPVDQRPSYLYEKVKYSHSGAKAVEASTYPIINFHFNKPHPEFFCSTCGAGFAYSLPFQHVSCFILPNTEMREVDL